MIDHDRITGDPETMTGKAVVRGTRITVELILQSAAAGSSLNEIADEYKLEEEDVRQAFLYAADGLRHEMLFTFRDKAGAKA